MRLVEHELMKCLQTYRRHGIKADLSIIISGADPEGKASLWKFDNYGVAERLDDSPGYACIGHGFFLGGNLLLQQFHDPQLQLDLKTAAMFSAYVIDQVSQIDPTVGRFEGELFYFGKEGLGGSISQSTVQEFQTEIEARQKLLRRVFTEMNSLGLYGSAAKVDQALNRGLELLRKEREEKQKAS